MNLSIKNAPEDVVERLKRRAERNHRSLQGELLAIVEAASREEGPAPLQELLEKVRRLGVSSPSESTAIIRAARDSR